MHQVGDDIQSAAVPGMLGIRTNGRRRRREEPRRADLIVSEAPRLLREFLQHAEQRRWPGTENVHETRKLTTVSSARRLRTGTPVPSWAGTSVSEL